MEFTVLSLASDRAQIEAFLAAADIRLDACITEMYAVTDGDAVLAMGGLAGNAIRSVAVAEAARGEGVMNTLISGLYRTLRERGCPNVFAVTKPVYAPLFTSLCFYELARTGDAVFLESLPNGFRRYLEALPKADAAIVMHANPFTLGHRYLVETAAAQAGRLLLFVLAGTGADVPFDARIHLVRAGTCDIPNVTVVSGGDYILSRAAFPDYFLKRVSDASRVHAELDATLFGAYVAPCCGITARYLGSEPLDPLTEEYNAVLARLLPQYGVRVEIVERLTAGGAPISASRARRLSAEGDIQALSALVPEATYRYLTGGSDL